MQVSSSAFPWTGKVISGLPLPGNTCDTRQLRGGRPQPPPHSQPCSGILSVGRFCFRPEEPGISLEPFSGLPRLSPCADCRGNSRVGLVMQVASSASPWTGEVFRRLPHDREHHLHQAAAWRAAPNLPHTVRRVPEFCVWGGSVFCLQHPGSPRSPSRVLPECLPVRAAGERRGLGWKCR